MPYNRERLDYFFKKYKLDGLLATQPETLKYFGYKLWFDSAREWMLKPGGSSRTGLRNLCLIMKKSKPVVIVPAFALSYYNGDPDNVITYGPFAIINEDNTAESKDIRLKNKSEKIFAQKLKEGIFGNSHSALKYLLKESKSDNLRIAVEYDGVSNDFRNELNTALNRFQTVDGSQLLRIIRMVKSPSELEIMREGFKITEEALHTAIKEIKPGVSFQVLLNAYIDFVESRGADFEHLVIMQNGTGMTDRKDFLIEGGRIIGFDAGIIYRSYITDTGITVFQEQGPKEDIDLYRKLYSIIEAGISAIKPGMRCYSIYEKMKEKSLKLSLENILFEGHGVGLSFREYPAINPNIRYNFYNGFEEQSADFTLEDNTVINLELGAHYFGRKTIQIEKTLIVNKDGCEPITTQDRNEPVFLIR